MENDKGGIHISNVTGEVSGVTYGGTGNITGKNIVVGSGTINVSEQQLSKIPNEYAESLRAFTEAVTNQLKNRQILEDHVKSINQSISELAKAIEGVKPGAEQEIDYEKQKNIEAKTGGLIQRVLNVLPQAAETATTFTPLAPLSKLIGKGVQEIVNSIQRRKSAPSVCHPITNIPSAPNSTIDAGYFIVPNGYMDEGLVSVNAETKYQGIGVGEAADGPVHHIDIGDTLYPDVSTKSCLDDYHFKLNSEKYIECYRALE